MSLHEQCVGATDEWYTPPRVFKAMNCYFSLDVASPATPVPWVPAVRFISERSLESEWHGVVWMNPPFGGRNALVPWLNKFIAHGRGVALVPDRTSAPWWQDAVRKMDRILFVSPKIRFIDIDGNEGASPAQGTTLMAIGWRGCNALIAAEENGLGWSVGIR